ncbi:MAG: ATP-binding protein [Desulfobacteraceae bacterium]|jgi:two-component system phosphate regulon sensor histidine kinase PhoR|nr:MAG: ATP-binding protein [Desulfobacteraceae bacterium]
MNEIALPPVNGDGRQLRRVFTNLLDNAIKFSNKGGAISLVTGISEGEIVIKVADQGIGIPYEDLPYIFDAFHRGKESTKIEGVGLGLATVKAIVEAHGGRVMVESELGKGSVFTLLLPLPQPATKVQERLLPA